MMTAQRYRDALKALNLSPDDAAQLFCVTKRKSGRWASGKRVVPRAVEIALTLMLAYTYPDAAVGEIEALKGEIRSRILRAA